MSVKDFYNEIKDYFIKNVEDITTVGDYSSTEEHLVKVKEEIVNKLIEFCSLKDNRSIYILKVKLETEFALDVNCTYCHVDMGTPKHNGCDLREILYDIDGNLIENGEDLLTIFNKKKLDTNVWHILTDIDDTIFPNKHTMMKGLAGVDSSWKSGEPYPGIAKFYEIFYNKITDDVSKYSTILSATPSCGKTKRLKDKSLSNTLGRFGFIQGSDSKLEAFNTGIKWITSRFLPDDRFEKFGKLKFERFKQYIKIFPEHDIIFIGDNGQGDELAGNLMLEYIRNNNLKNKCIVCIHRVSEDGKTIKEETSKNHEFIYFNNYYDLSVKFKEVGIFNDNDVSDINNIIKNQIKNTKYEIFYNSKGGKKTKKRKPRRNKTQKSRQKRK
jgi:hypothetical protein